MSIKQRAVNDEQKFKRRSVILDNAFQVFLKNPYAQVSMDQVALKSKLAKGTLYLYFKSKEELFLALKEREYDRWFDQIDSALESFPSKESFDSQVRWFASMVCKSFKEQQDMIRLVVSLHHTLERNIDKNTIIDFNRKIGQRILKSGVELEKYFSFLKKGEGAQLLLFIKAIVFGLNHVAEPIPLSKKALKRAEPELQVFQIDFIETLSRMLSLLLLGWHQGEEV